MTSPFVSLQGHPTALFQSGVEGCVNRQLSLNLYVICFAIIATGSRSIRADEVSPPKKVLPPAATRPIIFKQDIQPIFQKACVRCHGPEKQKGDYRLDVRETAFKGGESFAPNILSGKSENWFVGSITNENARELSLQLSFLDKGAHYKAKIFRDGKGADYKTNPYPIIIESLDVTSDTKLTLSLAPGGGTAIIISKI